MNRILYHARLHPSCPVPHLTEEEIQSLHHWVRQIPLQAVEVNADSLKFPEDWLFRWRWGKGKREKKSKARKIAKGDAVESDDEAGEDVKPKDKKFLPLVGRRVLCPSRQATDV